MRHPYKKEYARELDDFELAKLRAQDAAASAFKKSLRWMIISVFVIVVLSLCVLWLRSFDW